MSVLRFRLGQKVWLKEVPYEIAKVDGQMLHLKIIGDEKAPLIVIPYQDTVASGDLIFKSPFEISCKPAWDSLTERQKEFARNQYKSIAPYFEMVSNGTPKMEATKKIADIEQVSTKTVSLRVKHYNQAGLAGLAPGNKSGGRGTSRIDKKVTDIINDCIEQYYLRRPGVTVAALVKKVGEACKAKELDQPTRKTIQKRLDLIPFARVDAARKGKQYARTKHHVSRGPFPGADFPLSIVQIDHTPLDIMLVDREFRQPVGRPYLTLAIDVHTRMIYGYFLSLKAPSYVSVAMSIMNGILPKKHVLERFGLADDDWPLLGLPACIHVDNGKDFRSSHLSDFCNEYQITLEFRPVKTPQYGGHIERVIRTKNEQLHQIDGTTQSSVHHKGDYDAESNACLTLDELEEFLINVFLEYHLTIHSSIKMAPKLAWEKAFNKGLVDPIIPENQEKMFIDLLPYVMRTIQKDGVGLFDVHYTDEVLQSIRYSETQSKQKYKIKYDPRNISKVYLFNPFTSQYETLYLSDRRFGDMSLIELDQMKQIIKHENEIFNTTNLGIYWSRKNEIIEEAIAQKIDSKHFRKLKEKLEREAEQSKQMFGKTDPEEDEFGEIYFDPLDVNLDDEL